jgi:hypothetical protein
MYKKLVMISYGILATLYLLFLLLPLTQWLVNDGQDLIYFVPLLWLTLPITAFGVWYFFLKEKVKK